VGVDMQAAKKYYQMACDKGDQTGCNSVQALQAALDVLNKPEVKPGANQNTGAVQKRREAEARKLLEQ
jgi:TPR repeat protein